jgi:hypothetical protein
MPKTFSVGEILRQTFWCLRCATRIFYKLMLSFFLIKSNMWNSKKEIFHFTQLLHCKSIQKNIFLSIDSNLKKIIKMRRFIFFVTVNAVLTTVWIYMLSFLRIRKFANIATNIVWLCVHVFGGKASAVSDQSDQIGRIFAQRVIVYFG